MVRSMMAAAIVAAMTLGMAPAMAAPCKDAKGKFTKCPAAAAAPAKRCKTANGKFAKCGTPGAKPL